MTEDTREGDSKAQRGAQGPIAKRVVERMRAGRDSRKWTADYLAKRMTAAGMPWSRRVVAGLECGSRKDVTVDEIVALAFVFNVPVTGFLSNEPPEENLHERVSRLEAAVFGGGK